MIEVVLFQNDYLDSLTHLFDEYRMFYKQSTNLVAAKTYLQDRINNKDSVIFLAIKSGSLIGFTQIYPSFCSVRMAPICILYDLFVDSSHRKIGAAQALLDRAIQYAKEVGAVQVTLETAVTNINAQKLYEKIGFKKSSSMFQYYFQII